jgi:hypothetical protein
MESCGFFVIVWHSGDAFGDWENFTPTELWGFINIRVALIVKLGVGVVKSDRGRSPYPIGSESVILDSTNPKSRILQPL